VATDHQRRINEVTHPRSSPRDRSNNLDPIALAQTRRVKIGAPDNALVERDGRSRAPDAENSQKLGKAGDLIKRTLFSIDDDAH
jgi:hypothetical protein